MGIYDMTANLLDGTPQALADYQGKVLLIVNVASRCNFTPQYTGLETLYRRYRDEGLMILGFPCNQFAAQEPGGSAEIQEFCSLTYGVSFPIFAKVDVNGPQTDPLYAYLKAQQPGFLGSQTIKWNFTKFLIDRDGTVLRRYAPNETPEALEGDIVKLLRGGRDERMWWRPVKPPPSSTPRPSGGDSTPTRDEWKALLEQQLGSKSTRTARNQAITLCYARWYLQEPWLFKWAGMAAIASDQVGMAIAMADLVDAPHGLMRTGGSPEHAKGLLELGVETYGKALNLLLSVPLALHDATTRPLLLNDLDLVRQANDAIFDDIGWAHLAYLSGGIKALESSMVAPEQAALLEAFRMLDKGAHMMCSPAEYDAGTNMIKQAGLAMLRHEQMTILPPYMERMSGQGKLLASFGAWLDFEGTPALIGQPSFSGYYGLLAVMFGLRSVSKAEDRWEWIEGDVQGRWARIDGAYSEKGALHRRLEALAKEQPTILQQAAGALNRTYPTLALKVGPFATS